jgi:SAM-dependent methyltransferase
MVVDLANDKLLTIGNSTYFDRANVEQYLDIWPVRSESIASADINHVLEYVDGRTRITIINELYRVLEPGGKALVHVPYWASVNAYADPFLVWPPFTEMSMFYLSSAEFRERNKLDYPIIRADFDITYGYSYAPTWAVRADAARDHAVANNINIVTEVVFALTKKPSET